MLDILRSINMAAQVAEAKIEVAGSAARSGATAARFMLMEDRLDKLALVSMAVWELLAEKAGIGEEDLLEKIQEIDLRDGAADGKVTRKVARCPKCNRVMSPRHKRCLYCGAHRLNVTAFDQVT